MKLYCLYMKKSCHLNPIRSINIARGNVRLCFPVVQIRFAYRKKFCEQNYITDASQLRGLDAPH